MNIGFAGYSSTEFDEEEAKYIIKEAFDNLIRQHGKFDVVSGLTNLGIPALVYSEGMRRGFTLIGVACQKALEYDCWPVEEMIIVGKEWGDESKTFLESIDKLVTIGGGKQTKAEAKQAKELGIEVLEYEL